jgi:hypothetical protein
MCYQKSLLVGIFAFFVASCRPIPSDELPLPTQICLRTMHHQQPIPNAIVYVKYNVDSFPGYGQEPSYYDASFRTDSKARGCLAPVPEGKHWLVAFGYDSLYFPNDVFGRIRLEISLNKTPKIDTILYISE